MEAAKHRHEAQFSKNLHTHLVQITIELSVGLFAGAPASSAVRGRFVPPPDTFFIRELILKIWLVRTDSEGK